MFTFLAGLLTNIGLRFQLGYHRVRDLWNWLLGQLRDVQIAFSLMGVNILGSAALTVWFESNKPARWGAVLGYLIYCYIERKVAIPVWLLELGGKLLDRGIRTLESWTDEIRGRLPWWIVWAVGQPRPERIPYVTAHPHREEEPVWHDTSVGGHLFHVTTTVAMWAHAFLFFCGVFPVWKGEWFSASALLTVFILYFVGTEDFVNIKNWRRRFGYAVTLYALTLLGPMTVAALMPGTYRWISARFDYSEELKSTEAEGLENQATDDKAELADLIRQNRELNREYRREHLNRGHRGYDADWTPTKSDQWAQNAERIEELRHPDSGNNTSLVSYLNPRLALPAGLLFGFVGIVAMIWAKE